MIITTKKIILFQIILLLFNACKYQSQNIINSKLVIDKESVGNNFYKSKNLDQLFNVKNCIYFEPDYVGTSFDNYYVKNIVIQNTSKIKTHYILIFDNKDILRDTLKIPKNRVYSLNVKFENNKNGIALGVFEKPISYFKIDKNLELNNNLKLQPLSLNTKIIDCPLPIEFLSEENVGIEEYYHYGIQPNKTKIVNIPKSNKDDFSQWKGNYTASFEISRIEEDFKFNYTVKILSKENIFIIQKINNEIEEIKNLYIESDSKNKLIIKSKLDSTLEYMIINENNDYYLAGNTIYLLNPPNDKYLLKKEK
ncbi:hypothetical protein ACM39_04000 [Chryseobacterium sp. FH2]|uniref:hypothetical protein n=1 Tax=Chryseobacterium sp. FH2 TaxID=1674291 RepID=UPI00065ADE02|nr:hypothetical protein [Chryseobacterium sp. FH2]KMQ69266.1 hypothetical protein ACM39_04000 [Chryseobacterium sp. FH2]